MGESMKAAYLRAMEALYLFCIVVAGACMVAMTLFIPLGVFFRYVLNSALSWPEPASTIMMIYFSFIGAAAVYRANQHMAVTMVLDAVPPSVRHLMNATIHISLLAISLFMVIYGAQLVGLTWTQTIAEFPWMPVGFTYLPIPTCGIMTLLFIVERIWVGMPPPDSVMYSDAPVGLE
jgi:TRAP-type C4-dicarboxylate transport system permease small subunit